MSTPNVYLSYSSRSNDGIARHLTGLLRQRDISVWYDKENLRTGDIALAIKKAINESDVGIFLMDKESPWQKHEARLIFEQRKPIFLIVTKEEGRELAKQLFPDHVFWDFTGLRFGLLLPPAGEDKEPHYDSETLKAVDKLAREIKKLVQDKPSDGLSIAPASPFELDAKAKGEVFLSYAEEDEGFVGSLKRFLKDNGFAYWDYMDSERNYHTLLFLELEEVIMRSVATISVLSPAWKKSKWTVREYFFAEEINKPIFLLRARDPGPTLATAGFPYIDFTDDHQAGFTKLDQELRRKGL